MKDRLMLLIPILCLLGCEEEGLTYHETCRPYVQELDRAVQKFNQLESTSLLIHRFSNRKITSYHRHRRDGDDIVYCDVPFHSGVCGISGDDIYLYSSTTGCASITCTFLHELGHHQLSLRNSNDPDTIMYGIAYPDDYCMDLNEWN